MKEKIRSVNINERGQIVIPEDIRNDIGVKGGETLILIQKMGEVIIKKESDVLDTLESEESFWKILSAESMKGAWDKEDEVWDNIAKGG